MARLTAPRAEKREKILNAHGESRSDPWFWLRFRDDPAVDQYLRDENNFTDQFFADSHELKQKIFEELKQKISEDDRGVPVREGSYWYYSEIKKGQQYPVYLRSPDESLSHSEVLLDMNLLAEGKDFCELAYCQNSPDHSRLAYAVDFDGDESYTLFIRDLKTGEFLGQPISGVSDSFEWCSDSKAFYYNVLDEQQRPKQVYFLNPADPVNQPVLIYQEDDDRFFVSLDKSESGELIYLCVDGHNMSECYYMKSTDLNPVPTLIQQREADHEYEVSDRDGWFYIKTNKNARDYKIVKTRVSHPGEEYWEDFLPYEPGRLVEGFLLFNDYMVISEKKHCLPSLTVYHFNSGEFHTPELSDGESVFDLSISEHRDFHQDELRFCLQSMHRSPEVWSYHMTSGTKKLLKKYAVPDKNFSESDYVSSLIFAPSHDGQKIPVSLVLHKDLKPGPKTPLILSAYGAYGCSTEMDFRYSILPMLQRGFIYAQAHVRGGMDLGWDWYQNGKLLSKKNTFEDYLSVTRYLIDKGYTGQGQIIASSGSAGGLLLGYIANQAPDYYKGILAQVPFVDLISTMFDDQLPLTTSEYNEWGNPQEKEFYDYMKSYSPYDNVHAQKYPAIFAISGISDMRVTYWEPAKWIAKIRELNTGDQPVLLKTQMDSGHSGASGRYEAIEETAQELVWMLKIFNQNQ